MNLQSELFMSAGEALNFKTNNDVAIHVTDLTKAKIFYEEVLGFKLISKNESQLSFDTGTFTLWINLDSVVKSFIPSIDVSDIAKAREKLINAGCKIIKEFEGYRSFYAEDPFGIVFDVIEK